MNLIYKFDNEYSCDIEKNVIYDPGGCMIADLAMTVNTLELNLREMSDTAVWALCRPIVLAHADGIKQGRKQMIKKICENFGIKEGEV